MNLIDRKLVFFEMNFVHGETIKVTNPLGTDPDIAKIFIDNPHTPLISSSVLDPRTDETEEELAKTTGIWLSSTVGHLHLWFGNGSEKSTNDSIQWAQFFVVPDVLQKSAKKMGLEIVCMN